MEQISIDQNELIIQLLRDNQELLKQNNELLQKQERREKRKLMFKVVWYTLLLGIPMIAYYSLYSLLAGSESDNMPVIDDVGVSPAVLEELLRVYTGQ